jgi:HPt (histidine-containing phosphotransfer) domain-containing protein
MVFISINNPKQKNVIFVLIFQVALFKANLGKPGAMAYQIINTEYLETVSGGDKEIIRELYTIFSEQVPEMVNELETLLSRKDYYSLGMLAHKAKSSVAIMGMTDLALMLKTFEAEGKEGKNIENYESYIVRFEKETGMALKELENYVNNL